MFEEEYKRRYVFGADYGTSDFKYGPITQGEKPLVVENRGYFPEPSIVASILGTVREVVVGKDVPLFLESGADLATRLVYPMRSGTIAKDDSRSWRVIKELTLMALKEFRPGGFGFRGFYLVAALSAIAPRYMYETLFEIYREIAREDNLIHSATIIPQPLAVAIAHKTTSCVVVESGHGNTQVAPISRAPIRGAVVALNRGGSEANAITAEILKDAGYGDLAREEALVRRVKENLGLLPLDLDRAISYAKSNPEAVRAVYQVPGTRIKIDLGENSWARFLIGEYVFDPNHELFQSYFRRGMPRPRDAKVGDIVFYGMLNLADTIITSIERCPVELQPHLYGQVILSGGNFSWRPPEGLKGIAVDAETKLSRMLRQRGVENAKVTLSPEPQYAVWRGCIVFGYAVPANYQWSWERMEGWINLTKT
ncbi:MAG: hypothetical protein NXY59_05540 [Aigarchaeota archaeon]|nr:hypothetical protein [Candidatus Pelearchaeum maunauluense]